MMPICHSTKEMLALGKKLAHNLSLPLVIFLHGDLGVGKTTMIRGILQGLGYHGIVNSPSYSIIESYDLTTSVVHHCDFYRINHPQEIIHLGLAEYGQAHTLLCVEWPDIAISLLPDPDLQIYCKTHEENSRIVEFKSNSPAGVATLNKLTKYLEINIESLTT